MPKTVQEKSLKTIEFNNSDIRRISADCVTKGLIAAIVIIMILYLHSDEVENTAKTGSLILFTIILTFLAFNLYFNIRKILRLKQCNRIEQETIEIYNK